MKALKTQNTMTQENLLYLKEVIVSQSIATKITSFQECYIASTILLCIIEASKVPKDVVIL